MSTLDFLIILLLAWFLLYAIFLGLKNSRIGKKISGNIEVQPLALLLKTYRFNNYILNYGKKRTKLFKIIGELSIIYGIALMLYAIFFLLKNLLLLIFPNQSTAIGQASPIIPIIFGVTFTPPLDQLIIILIVIALAAIFHELFHGFIASSQEMKLKSTGAGLIFMIPIAFVELDDESLKNFPARKKLRMLGAGSFVNLLQAMIFLALILSYPLAIAWGFSYSSNGVLIYGITDNSPASNAGLLVGDAIIALNHTPIINQQEFSAYLEKTKPNETLTITVERDLKDFDITIKLAQHPYYKN
ncbi:MAG TPA: site-2 protease family protein, partial [Geobacterales bacterium]|nr:site-2 protease family protein [Geobacterales bacterium]